MLIAEDEKMEISEIKDAQNLVEIQNGSFGWVAQPDAPSGDKQGTKSKFNLSFQS